MRCSGTKGMGSLDGSKTYPGFSGWGCFRQWCKADFPFELTSTYISGHVWDFPGLNFLKIVIIMTMFQGFFLLAICLFHFCSWE